MSAAFSLIAVSLALLTGVPAPDDAQLSCTALPGRIYELEQQAEEASADAPLRMLALIAEGRTCIQAGRLNDARHQLTIWLLNNEVFALDLLGRHVEARDVVEQFFSVYADQAEPAFMAKMHAWRLHFHVLHGALYRGLASYAEAVTFAMHLPPVRQAHLLLDGAYLYLQLGQHSLARQKTQQALALLERMSPADAPPHEYRFASARAWQLEAELLLPHDPQQARVLLWKVVHHLPPGQRAAPLVWIGWTYTLEGDDLATTRLLQQALFTAEAHEDHRSAIHAHYRRGTYYLERRVLGRAEQDLMAAQHLAQTHGLYEYDAAVLSALGQLREQQGRPAEALAYYRATASFEAKQGDLDWKTLHLRHAAQASILRLSKGPGQEDDHPLYLFILLFLAGAALGSTLMVRRMLRAPFSFHAQTTPLLAWKRALARLPGRLRSASKTPTSYPVPPQAQHDALQQHLRHACEGYVEHYLARRDEEGETEDLPADLLHEEQQWQALVFEKALEASFGKGIWTWLVMKRMSGPRRPE